MQQKVRQKGYRCLIEKLLAKLELLPQFIGHNVLAHFTDLMYQRMRHIAEQVASQTNVVSLAVRSGEAKV